MSRPANHSHARRSPGNDKRTSLREVEPSRPFVGVWICASLWNEENLNPTEKLLIAEVDSLSKPEQSCFAGNKHLAQRLHVSPSHMRDMLSDLTRRGYLIRIAFDGRKAMRRVRADLSTAYADERRQALRAMPYLEYLDSPEWKAIRQRKLKDAAFRCQLCNDGGELNVHHRTYENRGNEDPRDLIVLCRPCHEKHHDLTTEAAQ